MSGYKCTGEQLLLELENLESMGITIWMEGILKKASRVAEDLYLNEISNYMRDYIVDDAGTIKELRFDRIARYML